MAKNSSLLKSSKMGEWEGFIIIRNENKSRISNLLEHKKLDPNVRFRGTTLLTAAIHRNSPDIVKMLLESGANPNKKSNENERFEPPIITATRLKHGQLVKTLVEHGAQLTLTNFYGEDAIYQAVDSNAFEILSYFLSIKAHGSCSHSSKKICPMHRAILEGEHYPSKRKCFLLLIKYHYTCSCQRLSSNDNKSYFSHLLTYSNTKSTNDLLKWFYLSYGTNLLPLWKTTKDEQVLSTFPTHLIKLSNLARICIRNEISNLAILEEKSFVEQLNKLPLPAKLINFLLMDELPI